MLRRCLAVVALVSAGSSLLACSKMKSDGWITVCAAVVDDDSGDVVDDEEVIDASAIDEVLVGLQPADPDTSWPAPERFTSCTARLGNPAAIELVDEDGAHVWLAVDVVVGGQQLITPAVFADLDGGHIAIAGEHDDITNTDQITLRDGDGRLRLALQHNQRAIDPAAYEGATFSVDDGGASGLASHNGCEWVTSRRLAFQGQVTEEGPTLLDSGEVGTTWAQDDYVVANVDSFEYGEETNCEDGANGKTLYSWVAVIDR